MDEICTLTIVLPVWFMWTISGMFSVWALLGMAQIVVDYKLRRLTAELGVGTNGIRTRRESARKWAQLWLTFF